MITFDKLNKDLIENRSNTMPCIITSSQSGPIHNNFQKNHQYIKKNIISNNPNPNPSSRISPNYVLTAIRYP